MASTRFLALLPALCLPFSFLSAHFPEDFESPLETVAFGSCNHQDRDQPLWEVIAAKGPDLWIWCGDNIYGDTRDAEVLEAKYRKQFERPEYVMFRESVPVIGTWDDHDYGENNAGAEYPLKETALTLALRFLEVPAHDTRWGREGIFSSYTFGPEGRRVKIILIDDRYFAVNPGKPGADLLGPAQQDWLESQLLGTDAQVNVLVSGIQILPEQQKYEKWANFPATRDWLLDLIEGTLVPGLFFISGDRHIHEISVLEEAGPGGALVEVTSSGMTHSWEDFPGEKNRYRQGPVFTGKGFGLLRIDWDSDPVRVRFEIRDEAGVVANALEATVGEEGRVEVASPLSGGATTVLNSL